MVEPGEPVAVVSGRHRKKLLARAEALLEGGDLDGYAVWKRVVKAVEKLLSKERPDGATVQ